MTVDVDAYHTEPACPNKKTIRYTTELVKLELVRSLKPCGYCALVKAIQKDTEGVLVKTTGNKGQCLSLDISSPKKTSIGGRLHCWCVLDEAMDHS